MGRRPEANKRRRADARLTARTARLMDRWTAAALLLLVVWAVATFGFAPAPGWVHLLLTAGVFLLVYGAVVRGTTPDARR